MATYSLAINGFGRIGRGVLRALYESGLREQLQVVAINELADLQTIAHLLKYDSVHGRFLGDVSIENSQLIVEYKNYRDVIEVQHQADFPQVQFQQDIKCVFECTGATSAQDARQFLAKNPNTKVLFSRPLLEEEADATIVYGLNHQQLNSQHELISAASCTTNAIVPLINTLHDAFGVDYGSTTTIHSLMNDQPVLDGYHHTDLRKTRAASHSMIPVETGLARGIERLLPELEGRFSSQALRVPVLNVSAIDISLTLKTATDVQAINRCIKAVSESDLNKVLAYSDAPLASSDFNNRLESGIFDATQTRMSGQKLLKAWVWFDNEWAYAHRMLDIAVLLPDMP